jgi:hypothetical protein
LCCGLQGERNNHSLPETWLLPVSVLLCIVTNTLKKELHSDTVFSVRLCSEFHVTYVIYKLVPVVKKILVTESHPQGFLLM